MSQILQAIADKLKTSLPQTLTINYQETTTNNTHHLPQAVTTPTNPHITINIPTMFQNPEDWIFKINIKQDNVNIYSRKFIRTYHTPTSTSKTTLEHEQKSHRQNAIKKVSLHDPTIMNKITQIIKQRSEQIIGNKIGEAVKELFATKNHL